MSISMKKRSIIRIVVMMGSISDCKKHGTRAIHGGVMFQFTLLSRPLNCQCQCRQIGGEAEWGNVLGMARARSGR
jgi:hypothetical protein